MNKWIKGLLKKSGLIPFLKDIRKRFNYKSVIKINNRNMITHRLYGAICEINEPWMVQVLKTTFEFKKGAFMDVGVNLGQTLMTVKSIDENKTFIGFEPNPSCIMYVEELIKFNKFKNVTLIPVGLFTTNSLLTMDLYYDDITNSGGSVIKDYWKYTQNPVYRKLIVPVCTYESIESSLGEMPFDILKIDVEGAELEVLNTLTDKVRSYKPIIIIEVLSAYSEENTLRYDRQIKLVTWIRENNYKIIRIEETSENYIKYLEEIEEFDVNYNHNITNYILFHNDDEQDIKVYFDKYLYTDLK